MPKAEFGSAKYIAKQQKLKGLQRLRWYCSACEKQCRDENGFKMHTQSESHVRQMLKIGEDPKQFERKYSNDFLRDFIQLLKTGHGEKQVQLNRFYNEYISNKEHVHMNATKWPSLTAFAKYLGNEGICRVEENEKGLHISWIDDSPEALRRKEALKRKELQDQGDEELEQRIIKEQIKRAQASFDPKKAEAEPDPEDLGLKRTEGEKIKLSFGAKPVQKPEAIGRREEQSKTQDGEETDAEQSEAKAQAEPADGTAKPAGFGGLSMKLGGKPAAKNVFAQAKKKNALYSGSKKPAAFEQPKKMSEAERIMKEEMERKRSRESAGFSMPSGKKQRNS